MNAEQQKAIADSIAFALKDRGILIEAPDPAMKPRIIFTPVEGDEWLTLVAWLTRSGYRISLDEPARPPLRCV